MNKKRGSCSFLAKIFSGISISGIVGQLKQRGINKNELNSNQKRILLGSIPFAYFALKTIVRKLTQKEIGDVLKTLTTDEYSKNMMEIWTGFRRAGIDNILEINLRATQGTVINRPVGTSKQFVGYDNLMFTKPPQLKKLPKPGDTPVDMKVTIGSKADRPLITNIPLLISGMAYGVALSESAKIALAKGAKKAGTSTNSGEGPYLREEHREAGKYILQISQWPWGLRTDEEIASADMLEVQISQGAQSGSFYLAPDEVKGKARELMGLPHNQGISRLIAPPGVNSEKDWPILINDLRRRAKGIPIGVKMMATNSLEEDLAVAIDLGFDVIAIDGAQGSALVSNPTMQDDFGIPSLHALVRAVRYLRERGIRDQISLIVSGGYFNPGSCLKALALGADAIYLGTVPLYALVNKQHKKVIPWEPATTLVSYSSKNNKKLDINLGAERVANVLRSMVVEMEQVIRALGKSSIKELNPDDLVALDDFSAELTGVKRVY
ncbi:FMN-binding glutamate synthase family protein [Candidatus Formimonas warabiya]|uniref:FMN-binding glutamate synthase family protein n=1 Tax=Formimonas warabiya TaxID=1761012 RepID=A0A3G1KTN6_FORW1|nr:FMN-binding glutamate synthase family protein [Candidatus Formimonas warabiya]ATW25819.1 FMN-binding glutamate synthase family protein [Candidatus Formimonas warabiya]